MLTNGDTVVAVTKAQLKTINKTRLEYVKYKDLHDNLKEQVKDQNAIIIKKDDIIASLTRQGISCDSTLTTAKDYIKALETGLKEQARLTSKAEAKVTVWKVIAGGLGLLSAYLAAFK